MTTDADGTFSAHGLAAGPLVIAADHPRIGRSSPRPVTESESESGDAIEIRLDEHGSAVGTVTKHGAPLARAFLSMELEGTSNARFSTMTDARGRYAFEKLGPGRYAASVRDVSEPLGPQVRLDQTIVVESGHTTTVSLELD
jgi:hypothetical protein